MRRSLWLSVAAILAATVVVVAGLVLLRPIVSPPGEQKAGEAGGGASPIAEAVADRPGCPGPTVGGVELPCLGGAAGPGGDTGVTVVNVWAWWCEPCREELPVVAEFAARHPEYAVVGVHADRAAAKGAALLNDLGVDTPSYQDDTNAFAGSLGLPGVIPVTVVLRDGARVGSFAKTFHTADELDVAVAGVL